MSLNVYLVAVRPTTVHNFNITHNLTEMADHCGLYKVMWRPEEIGVTHAGDAIPLLEKGIADLEERRSELLDYEPDNGWGSWDTLHRVAVEYLAACRKNPDAEIEVSR